MDTPPTDAPETLPPGPRITSAREALKRRIRIVHEEMVLNRPRTSLVLLAVLLAFFAYHTRNFRLEASADVMLLEDDPDLHLLRQLYGRYDSASFLVVAFEPASGDLFADDSLARLGGLRDELRALPGIDSVMTILDVPLVLSSDVSLREMRESVQTLESEAIDRERARVELMESPVFREQLVSTDGRTTALLLLLEDDRELSDSLARRNDLLVQRRERGLSEDERAELLQVGEAYEVANDRVTDRQHELIARVRSVMDRHRENTALHLGGLPMIADDMITFIKRDLVIFGTGVLLFLVIGLRLIFRHTRWVLLPLLSCFYATVVVIGLLGLVGWRVTVVSSNFLALMLIMTISMNIHLVVRYRQLYRIHPERSQRNLVSDTMRRMVWPCFYSALTTIIGFGSLVLSDIKPVQDFGGMMSAGLAVVFLTTFSIFPMVMVLMPKTDVGNESHKGGLLLAGLATLTRTHGNAILVGALLIAIVSAVGIYQLEVENSFISYFSEDSEIYQGLRLVDEKLGGTTPLQVLLHFGTPQDGNNTGADGSPTEADEFDEEGFDEWDLDVASEPRYWFTEFKIERIKQVHDYLDSLPEVGKVLSLASAIRVAEGLNDGQPFDSLELSILYGQLPDILRETLVDPYFSFAHDEARVTLRILDSQEGLRRAELVERIRTELAETASLSDQRVTVLGTLVLYNNMLESLYGSQIASLGAVMAGVGITLLILFRSVPLAIIALVPNLVAAGAVLGLMGLAGIPLDVMTMTIAAITVGIAVDNTIHYIYRFREELPKQREYLATLEVCHSTIGRAVLYTSATIIFGFSILAFSKFLPTIYFGVFTGFALFVALLATLTLLPRLILAWRPFA